MPAKGSGPGIHKDADGYLVVHRRGPHRNMFAHRAYVNWQLAECGQPALTANEEIDHLCKNRSCWPPSDGHLLIWPTAMADYVGGRNAAIGRQRKRRKALK